ncbi:hypothetical protein PNEG_02800 [Pneumocystis murina B123]|uniref:Sel1 repeat family protein n=1 Tax=Pneumocystis murina (strain B123) TaxID=1069680 RepID=M7NP32_PNEMU|nr:hypothetical protein PNEG_02800 [Pneumocystis murina B123]EMR09027.1 hypothetical protein PNEG_02800 [Pneumocystis murina B123]
MYMFPKTLRKDLIQNYINEYRRKHKNIVFFEPFFRNISIFQVKYNQRNSESFLYKNNEIDYIKDIIGEKDLYIFEKKRKNIKKSYSEILNIFKHMNQLKNKFNRDILTAENIELVESVGKIIPFLVTADELFLITKIMLKTPVSKSILQEKLDLCKFSIQIASLKESDLATLYIAEKKMQLGTPDQIYQALRIYKTLSKKGNAKALLILGDFAIKLKDTQQAEKNYLKSIEKGNSDAMVAMAGLKRHLGKDAEAKFWFIRASELNNPKGHFGRSLYTTHEESLYYLLQAASNGIVEAAHNLADIYRREGNTIFSKEWFEVAAFSGFQASQINLARLYEQEGLFNKSLFWIREAQKQGGTIAEEARQYENILLKKYPYLK